LFLRYNPAVDKKLETVLSIGALSIIGFGAFSKLSRKEIFSRDRATCQCCEGNFHKDGLMMHCAHFDHYPDDPDFYNDPDNGQLLCIRCHLFNDHLPQMDRLGDDHYHASVKLATKIYEEGYHTYKWNDAHPEQLAIDRDDLVQTFERFGYNPDDFIDIED